MEEISYKKFVNLSKNQIRKVCLSVENLLNKMDLAETDSNDVVLAIDEVLTNIHEHGYRKGVKSRPVKIEIFKGWDKIYIMISDHAKPYTIDIPDDFSQKEYLKSKRVGGFGLYIIKKLMTEVCLFQLFDENILILTKTV